VTANDLVVTRRGLRFRGRHFPCTIGRNGISDNKREGDRATPAGLHHITGALYRPDRIARPCTWAQPILPGDLWSDDSRDPAYNTLVRAPHQYRHETLRRADPLYDLILLTDWNWPHADPAKGSAIFIHRMRKPGHPTEGCIGLPAPALLWITANLWPGMRLIVPS